MCVSDLGKKLRRNGLTHRERSHETPSGKRRPPLHSVSGNMPPSTSLFPGCCCAKNVNKSKNEQKAELAVALKTKQQLVIPKVALNGRIINSGKRHPETVPVHVAIEIPDEFVTARTSRGDLNNQHLSMNELMRVVRIEEGLNVTPRDRHHTAQEPSTSKPTTVDLSIVNITPTPRQKPLALDARQLAHRERVKKAVFDTEGDITTRTGSTQSPRTGRRSVCSVATISGNQNLTLPQPPPPPTYASYMTYVPQMLLAMITISFAWLANLITYVYR